MTLVSAQLLKTKAVKSPGRGGKVCCAAMTNPIFHMHKGRNKRALLLLLFAISCSFPFKLVDVIVW